MLILWCCFWRCFEDVLKMFRSAWCGNSAGNWDPLHSVHLVALRLAALPFVASSSALHRLHPLDLAMTCDMAPRWTQVLARSKICQPGEMPPRRHQVISLLYAIWQKFKDQIMIQIQKALLIQSAPASILHFSGHSRCPGGCSLTSSQRSSSRFESFFAARNSFEKGLQNSLCVRNSLSPSKSMSQIVVGTVGTKTHGLYHHFHHGPDATQHGTEAWKGRVGWSPLCKHGRIENAINLWL